MTLTDGPPPLTPGLRRAAWILTAAIIVIRIATMAASPWDWDEILFLLAMRDYDVLFHQPHPPGFPLFIAAAYVLRALGLSDFHALQALNVFAGAILFPVALQAFREMRFAPRTAFAGAAILVFFPNVWFFGGGAFSDVPSLAAVLAAIALLLCGARSNHALIAGFVVLAVSAGIRPQNLMIGMVPAAVGTWYCLKHGRWRALVAGLLAGLAIVTAAYGWAIVQTGWARYEDAVEAHRQFIATYDSFFSPLRPSLWRVFDDFFVRPYRAPLINTVVAILAAVGLVRGLFRRGPIRLALLTFGPFALMAWVFLDPMSASRFSIAYAPLVAIAAAEGIAILSSGVASPDSSGRRMAETLLAAALVLLMIVWSWPAVIHVRNHESPPVAAARWLLRNTNARTTLVYAHETVLPFVYYYLPRHSRRDVHDETPPRMRSRAAYFITEGETPEAVATFVWPRGRLWNLARQRYFVASVSRTESQIQFGTGWHDEEHDESSRWRWMAGRSVTDISGESQQGVLRLEIEVPLELLSRTPDVTVRWNDHVIDRFRGIDSNFERSYRLTAPGRLVIETSVVANLARERQGSDTRDLGLKLRRIQWRPDAE